MILPSFAHDLHKADRIGLLRGISSQDRYRSYFIDGENWSSRARELPKRYPFLFELGDGLLSVAFLSLSTCLERLISDKDSLYAHFQVPREARVAKVDLVGESDQHCSERIISISLDNGQRLLYKPRDLRPDLFFQDFVQMLNLPNKYALRFARVLSRQSYGWLEWIDPQPCQSTAEVKRFFIRCGSLLAVADALNYSDGHYSNMIACRDYPILVDLETTFQNYSCSEGVNKSLCTTYLIQKRDADDNEEQIFSALQTPSNEALIDSLTPFPINDHSDRMTVRYRSVSPEPRGNCAALRGHAYTASPFVEEVCEGFSFVYDRISRVTDHLIRKSRWWQAIGRTKCRVVVRGTFAYQYLIRMLQRPEQAVSRIQGESYLREKLWRSPYASYEITELLRGNIPYFFHHPAHTQLFTGDGASHPSVFSEPGLTDMRRQLKERCDERCRAAIREIRSCLGCG